jgi:hypothetical protein
LNSRSPHLEFLAGSTSLSLDRRNRAVRLARGDRAPNLLRPVDEPWLQIEGLDGTAIPLDVLEPGPASGSVSVASADGRVRVSLAVRGEAGHLAFEVSRLAGVALPAVVRARLRLAVTGVVGEHIATVHGGSDAVGFQGLTPYSTGRGDSGPDGPVISVGVWAHADAPRRSFALFACAGNRALEAIGAIEIAEGLPHPMVGGAWAKESRATRQSYLVANFAPPEVSEALGYAERSGLGILYLPPWIWSPGTGSWGGRFGHFDVNTEVFRGGRRDLCALADTAAAKGVAIGAHTMSAWISPDDTYVSPLPHAELGYWSEGRLAGAVDAAVVSLGVRPAGQDGFGRRPTGQWYQYRVVRVGDELVRYESMEEKAGVALLTGCTRGAFGTVAAPHAAGAGARFLVQAYDHFVPEPGSALEAEQARQLADVMNACRLGITSFDGLEAHDHRGEWGMNLFVEQVFREWDHHVLCDASLMNHYLWHVLSRGNWGENMVNLREETERRSRLDNVALQIRNLLPPALGWWPLRLRTQDYESTSPDDFEYILAKCAGYDALFCVETDVAKLRAHPQTGRILELVKSWESLRNRDAFTPEQRELLRTPGMDFRLDTSAIPWRVTPVKNMKRLYAAVPAEGAALPVSLTNPYGPQPLRFTVRVTAALERGSSDGVSLLPRSQGEIRRFVQAGALAATLGRAAGGAATLALACDHTHPFDEAPPASNAPTIRDRGSSPPVRLLWAAPGGSPGIDLSRHRGLGLWLDAGQGCPCALLFVELIDATRQIRQYYAPLDAPGRRWVEWPNGEASADDYYDYEWARGPDCGFWQALKWFDYAHTVEVRIGLIRVPPGARVAATVEDLRALPERDRELVRPRLSLGAQSVEIEARVRPEHYLVYEGGGRASVYDANWGLVAEAPARGKLVVPEGASTLALSTAGSGLGPWLGVQLRVVGSSFSPMPAQPEIR